MGRVPFLPHVCPGITPLGNKLGKNGKKQHWEKMGHLSLQFFAKLIAID